MLLKVSKKNVSFALCVVGDPFWEMLPAEYIFWNQLGLKSKILYKNELRSFLLPPNFPLFTANFSLFTSFKKFAPFYKISLCHQTKNI